MIAYIILIVVVAVLLLGVGGTMLLRPRGMHGRSNCSGTDTSLVKPIFELLMMPAVMRPAVRTGLPPINPHAG